MNSFKDIAYQILEEAGKPLHSKEITKIASERGWLRTVVAVAGPDLITHPLPLLIEGMKEVAPRFLFAMGFVRGEMNKKELDIILKEGMEA